MQAYAYFMVDIGSMFDQYFEYVQMTSSNYTEEWRASFVVGKISKPCIDLHTMRQSQNGICMLASIIEKNHESGSGSGMG
jgi:hypothetical protein